MAGNNIFDELESQKIELEDKIEKCRAAIQSAIDNQELSVNIRENTINSYKREIEGYREKIQQLTQRSEQLAEEAFWYDKDVKTAFLYTQGQLILQNMEGLSDKKVDIKQIKKMAEDESMADAIKKAYTTFEAYQNLRGTVSENTMESLKQDVKAAFTDLGDAYDNYDGTKQQSREDFIKTVMYAKPNSIVNWNHTSLSEIFTQEIRRIDSEIYNRQKRLKDVYIKGINNGVRFTEFERMGINPENIAQDIEADVENDLRNRPIPPRPVLPVSTEKPPFFPWGNAREEWNERHPEAGAWKGWKEWRQYRKTWKENHTEATGKGLFRFFRKEPNDNQEDNDEQRIADEKESRIRDWNFKVNCAENYGKRNHGYNAFRNELKITENNVIKELRDEIQAEENKKKEEFKDFDL